MACVASAGLGTLTLDIAGTLALAGASGADVAAVAALLPDLHAGMMAGVTKSAQGRTTDG